jgi:hypothetical protein
MFLCWFSVWKLCPHLKWTLKVPYYDCIGTVSKAFLSKTWLNVTTTSSKSFKMNQLQQPFELLPEYKDNSLPYASI